MPAAAFGYAWGQELNMSQDVVTVVARIKVKAGLETQALQALQSVLAPTRAEPGCLNYDLHQSLSDPTEFLFHENWTNQAALDAHANSTAEHRLALRQQLGALIDGPPSLTTWRRVD